MGTIDDLESYWTVRCEVLEPVAVRPAPVPHIPRRGEAESGESDLRAANALPPQRPNSGQPANHRTDAHTLTRPAVFIGSSTLGRPIAEHLKIALEDRYHCDVTVWYEGVFELGGFTLASLETAARKMDFAVLVATADDTLTTAEGKTSSTVRDNVVFELGLFIGALGSERVYIVADQAADLHLPSDLGGVTWAPYRERADGNLDAAVGSPATRIGVPINRLGRRDDTHLMSSGKFVIPPPSEDPPESSRAPTGASDEEQAAPVEKLIFSDGLLEMQADRWRPGTFGGVSGLFTNEGVVPGLSR